MDPGIDSPGFIFWKTLSIFMDLIGKIWTPKGQDIERSPYGVPTVDLGSIRFI